MSRKTYRQVNGKWVEVTRTAAPPTHHIMPDIEPYQSVITGEQITSRSQHREHLKMHGKQEVGNEVPKFLQEKYERDGTKPEWGRDGRRVG